MFQPEINKDFTPHEIATFVLQNDQGEVFKSAKLNPYEFETAIHRLNEVHQIIVFKNGQRLWGVLGWFFVTEENKHRVHKQLWRLPQNLTEGEILYLHFIITRGDCDVLAIKRMFEDMGYRKRITKRRGFTKGKWYEHPVKG